MGVADLLTCRAHLTLAGTVVLSFGKHGQEKNMKRYEQIWYNYSKWLILMIAFLFLLKYSINSPQYSRKVSLPQYSILLLILPFSAVFFRRAPSSAAPESSARRGPNWPPRSRLWAAPGPRKIGEIQTCLHCVPSFKEKTTFWLWLK